MSAASIFNKSAEGFTRYAVEMQVTDKMIGGIPKDPDTIKAWLRSRLDMEDRTVIELAEETAAMMQAETEERPSADELLEGVARRFEGGNGFKTVDGHLVYEGRCMKAGLKEAANIAYPGSKYPGQREGSRKGLMRTLAETVFVEEQYIDLGVSEPSGTEQRIKHITGPQGPRSAINVVDYVDKPRLCCTVRVLDDFLPETGWGRLWSVLENIGLGSDRARSDGKFELLRWERLPG